MMHPSRRRVLAYAGLSPFVFPRLVWADDKGTRSFSDVALKGKLHLVGMHGHTFPSSQSSKEKTASVLSTIDLETGRVRQTQLPIGEGHSAMGLGDGRILCVAHHMKKSMVLDAEHNPMRELYAGDDYVYGGHGVIRPAGRGVFVLPLRHARQRTPADTGRFQVFDMESLDKLDEISSEGLHPHELVAIPGTDELCVTHYGDIFVQRPVFVHNVVEPKLTIYDASTLKVRRHYPQREFGAMLTHMRVAEDKHAYCVLTQYVGFDRSLRDTRRQMQVAVAEFERVLGHKPDFLIPYQSRSEGQIALPLPLLRIDTQTGNREIILVREGAHLRSQSVACNTLTGKAAAVYYHSDNIILHGAGENPETITANDLGLSEIRGIAEIPGTRLMATNGTFRGTALFDVLTKRVLAYYDTQNYHAPHIDFAAV